ncbi:MAG: CoA pyrophosphatase [Bacteroidota bacterium]
MHPFHRYLKQKLADPLPGAEAQFKMAPRPKHPASPTRSYTPTNSNYRNSSVLVPILDAGEELEIVFTLRTSNIKHGGQISFPGGGKEGNETIDETALREAREETGIQPEDVRIAGHLSDLFVNHSDNMVTPVVGFLNTQPTFVPNPNEVDEIFTIPISQLLDEEHQVLEEWDLRDTVYEVPFWNIHRVPLWGATAMMLAELMQLYEGYLSVTE